ncbi:MAG: cytochrome c biogenesis protein ResB [Anaerolineae bacterium]|nr:cytochrome c biogenesis protein ResB [Anaerolineae bacterium]
MRRLIRFFGRPTGVAGLFLLALGMAALGSCFPQRPAGDPTMLARWEEAVRARYGPLTDLLAAVGLFRWYTSAPFLLVLAFLATATLLCMLNRWPAFRLHLHRCSVPHWGTLMIHLSVLLLLLSLALSSLGWREEQTLAPGGTISLGPGAPALRYDGIAVDRYPDGSVADYRVAVTVLVDGREAQQGTIRPNAPLSLGGRAVFLSGYTAREGQPMVTLLVVSDPGYIPFLVAGGLFLLGLILMKRWE